MTHLELGLFGTVIGLLAFVLGRMWGDKRFEEVKIYIDQKLEYKRSKDVCEGMRTECAKLTKSGFDGICERLRRIEDRLDKMNERNTPRDSVYERGVTL